MAATCPSDAANVIPPAFRVRISMLEAALAPETNRWFELVNILLYRRTNGDVIHAADSYSDSNETVVEECHEEEGSSYMKLRMKMGW